MRKLLSLIALLGLTGFGSGLLAQSAVHWMKFDQAVQLSQKNKKKLLVDIYTDWCSWCKYMDKNTYADEKVIQNINKYYYAVKFNAEQKEDIQFNGKTYRYVRTARGGYHELAAELLKGQLGFPSTVFLDESQGVLQSIQGYQDPANFEKIVVYFGENHYKKTPWTKFEREYQPAAAPTDNNPKKIKQTNVKGQ